MSVETPKILSIFQGARLTDFSVKNRQPLEKTQVSLDQFIGLLEGAALARPQFPWQRRVCFLLPFYKEIGHGEKPCQLLFRREEFLFRRKGRFKYLGTRFNLDLVFPYGHGKTEQEGLWSDAWVDFSISNRLSPLDAKREPFGSILIRYEINGLNTPWVLRPGIKKGNFGIYVAEELRRKGIAKALASGARIILSTMGIEELIAKDVRKDTPAGFFYESLGAEIFNPMGLEDNQVHVNARLPTPTEETEKAPYFFR